MGMEMRDGDGGLERGRGGNMGRAINSSRRQKVRRQKAD